jgi:integrase
VHGEDLDLDNGVVHIRRGMQLRRGRPKIVDDLKTTRSRRSLGLSADVVDWLAEHRRRQIAQRLAAPRWDDDRLVFASSHGTVLFPTDCRGNWPTSACAPASR